MSLLAQKLPVHDPMHLTIANNKKASLTRIAGSQHKWHITVLPISTNTLSPTRGFPMPMYPLSAIKNCCPTAIPLTDIKKLFSDTDLGFLVDSTGQQANAAAKCSSMFLIRWEFMFSSIV